MIRRDNLLETFSEVAPTKLAALQFESGPLSLTNAVLASSRRVLLIGKDSAYDIDQWPSNIFRSGMQENLIISDNQTRDFDAEITAWQGRPFADELGTKAHNPACRNSTIWVASGNRNRYGWRKSTE